MPFILGIISFAASAEQDHLLHHSPPYLQGHANDPIKQGWEILQSDAAGSQAWSITLCVLAHHHACLHVPQDPHVPPTQAHKPLQTLLHFSIIPSQENSSSVHFVSTGNSSPLHWVTMIPFCSTVCRDRAWISTMARKDGKCQTVYGMQQSNPLNQAQNTYFDI